MGFDRHQIFHPTFSARSKNFFMLGWFGGTFHPTYKKYPEFERLNVPLRMECLYSDVRNQKMEACFLF